MAVRANYLWIYKTDYFVILLFLELLTIFGNFFLKSSQFGW